MPSMTCLWSSLPVNVSDSVADRPPGASSESLVSLPGVSVYGIGGSTVPGPSSPRLPPQINASPTVTLPVCVHATAGVCALSLAVFLFSV